MSDELAMLAGLQKIKHLVESECGGPPRNPDSLLYQCWKLASEALPVRPTDDLIAPHSTDRARSVAAFVRTGSVPPKGEKE